jgi:hypothetical protein
MPHQRPFRLVHFVFETSRLFLFPFGSVESAERIDKPAVPKHGDAEFSVQVFPVRAVHHEKKTWIIGKWTRGILQHDVAALKPTPGGLSGCAS